jgi:hypothetical protein
MKRILITLTAVLFCQLLHSQSKPVETDSQTVKPQTNQAPAQNNKLETFYDNRHLVLKTDVIRGLMLQPIIAVEYFNGKRLSLEAGGSYFFTGMRFYGDDVWTRDVARPFAGFGPSHGIEAFADLKWKAFKNMPNPFYLGVGYAFRASSFDNVTLISKVSSTTKRQEFKQTENFVSNGIRTTMGVFIFPKKHKEIILNPYLAITTAYATYTASRDTIAGDPSNKYKYIAPESVSGNKIIVYSEIGFKICFGLKTFPPKPPKQTKAKEEKEDEKKVIPEKIEEVEKPKELEQKPKEQPK